MISSQKLREKGSLLCMEEAKKVKRAAATIMNDTVFLVDTTPPIHQAFAWSVLATDGSRWKAVQQTLLSLIEEPLHTAGDFPMGIACSHATITPTGLVPPSTQLCGRLRHVDLTGEPQKATLFHLLQQGFDLLATGRGTDGQIVLITCRQGITLSNDEIQAMLVWIDQMRQANFRLHILGLDFEHTLTYQERAPTPSKSINRVVDMGDNDSSDEDDDDEEKHEGGQSDYDTSSPEELCTRTMSCSKEEIEEFLASFVEKTGGSVISISNAQELQTTLGILCGFGNKHASDDELVVDRLAKKQAILSPDPAVFGWIVWGPSSKKSIEDFVESNLPTKVSAIECSWIAVDNVNIESPGYDNTPDYDHSDFRQEPFLECLKPLHNRIQANQRILPKERMLAIENMKKVAIEQNNVVGKWVIRVADPKTMDDFWRKVAIATAKGRLGCSSKICPFDPSKVAVCCVYVRDFRDKREIQRVRLELDRLELPGQHCGFKPDYYTDLNIYSNNRWKIPATLYSPKEAREWSFE